MARVRNEPTVAAKSAPARPRWWLLASVGCLALTGCGLFASHHHGPPPEVTGPVLLENPLLVPMTDVDFVWDQVVDAIDDHFRIQREERLRLVGNVLNEGRLETFPTIGSTLFEPWKNDSSRGFERWQSTLQSIQRRASARVTPAAGGLQIEVIVGKELEDLYQPEHATVGGTTLRYDGSVVRAEAGRSAGPVSLGWIPLGRDVQLEQRLLLDIQARVVDAGLPPAK